MKEFPAFTPFAIDLKPYQSDKLCESAFQIREKSEKTNKRPDGLDAAGDNWFKVVTKSEQ